MGDITEEEFEMEMRAWLLASASSFLFWDNELDAKYDYLTRLDDTAPAPESAQAASLALICTDYEAMAEYGDLGGTEAEALKK